MTRSCELLPGRKDDCSALGKMSAIQDHGQALDGTRAALWQILQTVNNSYRVLLWRRNPRL